MEWMNGFSVVFLLPLLNMCAQEQSLPKTKFRITSKHAKITLRNTVQFICTIGPLGRSYVSFLKGRDLGLRSKG